jgi:Ctf8.
MILTKAEKIKEILMIEIQGEIQYFDNIDGVKLGNLEENQGKCKFLIGNHNLCGKVEYLSKPLVLITKTNGNLQMTGIIKKNSFFLSDQPQFLIFQNK